MPPNVRLFAGFTSSSTLHLDAGPGEEDTACGEVCFMARVNRTLLVALAALAIVTPVASAGQFKKAVYYRAGMLPSQVVTGDFNNDGNTDLAFADWLSNQLVVLLGNGDGTFRKPLTIRAPSPTALAVGDLNGDGNLDLAVIESGGSGSGALAVY